MAASIATKLQFERILALQDEIASSYIEDGLSIVELVKLYCSSPLNISRILKIAKVQLRSNSIERAREIHSKIDEIKSLYLEHNLSLKEIGEHCGIYHTTVGRLLRDSGVELRKFWENNYTKPCKFCGILITSNQPKAPVCDSCEKEYSNIRNIQRRRKEAGYPIDAIAKCKYCNRAILNCLIHKKVCDDCVLIDNKNRKLKSRLNNPEHFKAKAREYAARRRMRKYGREADDLPEEVRQLVISDCENKCVYCGKRPRKLTIDHILALANGGDNSRSNLTAACRSCNSSKNDGYLLNWIWRRLKENRIIGVYK